ALAVQQAALVLAVAAADGQVALVALAVVGAAGVEAAEAAQVVVHAGHPGGARTVAGHRKTLEDNEVRRSILQGHHRTIYFQKNSVEKCTRRSLGMVLLWPALRSGKREHSGRRRRGSPEVWSDTWGKVAGT